MHFLNKSMTKTDILPKDCPFAKHIFFSPLLPLILFLIPAIWGVDFGYHSDENYGKIRSLVRSLEDGIFMQGEYMYGGLNFLLTCIPILPKLFAMYWNGILDPVHVREQLVPYVTSEQYRISVRYIFIFISSLTIPGIYFISNLINKDRIPAFIASMFFALSWEANYHSRWIAPDFILTTLATFTFFFILLALVSNNNQWHKYIYTASILAGLGTGAKYPGGFLLLPIFITAFYLLARKKITSALGILRCFTIIFALFCLTFYLTTPAIILHPFAFFQDVKMTLGFYSKGFNASSIEPGPPHFFAIFRYLSRDFFSHFQLISYSIFLLSVIGAYTTFKSTKKEVFVFLVGTPAAYILYFSNQFVMAPRNYLLTTPILCILCASGLVYIYNTIKAPLVKNILPLIVIFCFILNFLWLCKAAESVSHRTNRRHELNQPPKYLIEQLIAYIKSNPKTCFIPSKLIRQDLKVFNADTLPNIGAQIKNPEDVLVCYQSESVMQDRNWPAIGRHAFSEIIGPLPANLHYASHWNGAEWIFLIPHRNFSWLPKFIPKLIHETPPPPIEDRLTHARWGYTHGL